MGFEGQTRVVTLPCESIYQDKPTTFGRVYDQDILSKIVNLTNKMALEKGCMLIGPGSDQCGAVRLVDVVGMVRFAKLVDGAMFVDVEILDTPKGLHWKPVPTTHMVVTPILTGSLLDERVTEVIRLNSWEVRYREPEKKL